MKKLLFLLVVAVLSSSIHLAADEGHHHDFDPNEKLGTVSFPVSCSPESQKRMDRGVALLHSFWYEEAEKQFADMAASEPKCAMTYWGQAMAQFHQLWERVEAPELRTGRAFLDKAKAAHPKTKREKEYIAALEAFYRPPDNADYQKRLEAYADAMKKVYQDNPPDHEAAAFYALSLIAAQREEDATQARTREAVAILKPLFEAEPDHPGIAHYLIHACDTPQLAPEALAAARKYASIAPSSAHAVHMPSHIFARLGLWQEDIQSNLASVAATKKATEMHMGGAAHALHAMDFLEYAYLQIGDDAKAKAIVDELKTFTLEEHDAMAHYLGMARVVFPANYALETRDWRSAAALTAQDGTEPHDRSITYWAQAIGAGHLKDKAAAEAAVKQFNDMLAVVKKGSAPYMAEHMEQTDGPEATAWMDFAEGKEDDALKLLRSVADRQDAEGKGEVEIPAREMLGDMLLEMSRPEEALVEYERSLKTDPNRFNGLYGAGRAAELTHQQEKANGYYSQLLKNCTGDSDRPELARVRTMLAVKQ